MSTATRTRTTPTVASGVGKSTLRSSFEAATEATRTALGGLPAGKADFVMAFATAGHDQGEFLRGIAESAPGARVVGCSGEGVITNGEAIEEIYAATVLAVRSDALSFDTFVLENYSDDPARRAIELSKRLEGASDSSPILLLLFPDGLTGDCTGFLRTLGDNLPFPVATAGGTAGDAMAFERTYQYHGDRAYSDSISGVLISGRGEVEIAVSHGCKPLGSQRRVTDAEGGWVKTIDELPAWDVFKEYLDGNPKDLNAEGIVHLCLAEPLDPEEAAAYEAPYIIRTPMNLDESNGALFFPGGGMASGAEIQLTRRDRETITSSARRCAEQILESHGGRSPSFVLQFDCAGRGRVLFGSCAAEEAVIPLQKALGETIPWIGFHTYGEIAPICDRIYYHNYTVVLCAFYEAE